jgi:hypothetical protein
VPFRTRPARLRPRSPQPRQRYPESRPSSTTRRGRRQRVRRPRIRAVPRRLQRRRSRRRRRQPVRLLRLRQLPVRLLPEIRRPYPTARARLYRRPHRMLRQGLARGQLPRPDRALHSRARQQQWRKRQSSRRLRPRPGRRRPSNPSWRQPRRKRTPRSYAASRSPITARSVRAACICNGIHAAPMDGFTVLLCCTWSAARLSGARDSRARREPAKLAALHQRRRSLRCLTRSAHESLRRFREPFCCG